MNNDMFIQRLRIEHYGGIAHLDRRFTSGISTINAPDPAAVLSALRVLLRMAPQSEGNPSVKAGRLTRLLAEVVVEHKLYVVQAQGRRLDLIAEVGKKDETQLYNAVIRRCREEDRVCVFDPNAEEPIDPARYLPAERIYKPEKLFRFTDGMSATGTFRACLKDFLEHRALTDPGCADPATLFLDAVRFWDEISAIRDLHYEGKPLLLLTPPPALVRAIQEYDRDVRRQKILVTSSIKARA